MYRRSNKQLSGKYADLNGKRITWEENRAYLNPASYWEQKSGKIVSVGREGKSYFVDCDGSCYWVDPAWEQFRNVDVETDESRHLKNILENMEGWSDPDNL